MRRSPACGRSKPRRHCSSTAAKRHVAELLDRLGDSRFVAVTGTSGSGKSSLVRAGLRPALQSRLSGRRHFALAFRHDAARRRADSARSRRRWPARSRHSRSSRSFRCCPRPAPGCRRSWPCAGLGPGESLLIIADQFEELFRFDVTPAQQGNAALFVSLLLEATERRDPPVYVVVTMRSEFLGRLLGVHRPRRSIQPQPVPRAAPDPRRAPRGDRPAAEAVRHRAVAGAGPAGAERRRGRSRSATGDAARAAAHLSRVGAGRRRPDASSGSITTPSAAIERALDRHGDEMLARSTRPGRRPPSGCSAA